MATVSVPRDGVSPQRQATHLTPAERVAPIWFGLGVGVREPRVREDLVLCDVVDVVRCGPAAGHSRPRPDPHRGSQVRDVLQAVSEVGEAMNGGNEVVVRFRQGIGQRVADDSPDVGRCTGGLSKGDDVVVGVDPGDVRDSSRSAELPRDHHQSTSRAVREVDSAVSTTTSSTRWGSRSCGLRTRVCASPSPFN
jgi:hypothetical protein